MVALNVPKSPHAVGLGTRTHIDTIFSVVDVQAGMLFEEKGKRAIGKVENIAATHAEQAFKFPLFNGGQGCHAAPDVFARLSTSVTSCGLTPPFR
ncbi:hypothetical protein D3C72_1966460 [compost metagenome]